MQIFFERSGGFMGLRLQAEVDTAELTIEEAQEWEQALDAAEFFEVPSNLEEQSEADRLIYKIKVVTIEQEHTAQFTDKDAPEELRPLLHRLTLMARGK
jgi:hypothetical protein